MSYLNETKKFVLIFFSYFFFVDTLKKLVKVCLHPTFEMIIFFRFDDLFC